jgi:membrane fusion protein (multidrug efflux system)
MFARLKVDLGTRPNSLLVPERGIAELQGKNFVWVVGSDNKASQRPVKVGDSIGDSVVILEGLKPGEQIVVEGLQKVREDLPVHPMPAAQVAGAEATNALSRTGRE